MRYLCGINIAWNPWDRKYDFVKIVPELHLDGKLKPSGDVCSQTGAHSTQFSAFSTITVTIGRLVGISAGGFVVFPQESAI